MRQPKCLQQQLSRSSGQHPRYINNMVRFKNRHILVEFLQPSSLSPAFNSAGSTSKRGSALAHSRSEEEAPNDLSGGPDDDDEAILQPELPFMLLLSSDGSKSRLNLGDDGGSVIYRAVRGSIQEVYGDEGWGRVASSFKGESYSLS